MDISKKAVGLCKEKYKEKKNHILTTIHMPEATSVHFEELASIFEAVNYAREIENENSNIITPLFLVKEAKRIAKEDKVLFDSLIEFEKTRKIKTKTRLNFTIDKSIALKFRNFCKSKGYNMSAKIEQIMEDMIKKR